jgi:hypothetical protein
MTEIHQSHSMWTVAPTKISARGVEIGPGDAFEEFSFMAANAICLTPVDSAMYIPDFGCRISGKFICGLHVTKSRWQRLKDVLTVARLYWKHSKWYPSLKYGLWTEHEVGSD